MPIRNALAACALVFGILSVSTPANAGDNYGGFGPSETDTQEIGSDPDTGAPAPADDQNTESIEQQTQGQQDIYGSEGGQQGAVEEENPNDDEDGH